MFFRILLKFLKVCRPSQSGPSWRIPGLESLKLGGNFKRSLERVSLPSQLQRLTLGNLFNQSLEAGLKGSDGLGLREGHVFFFGITFWGPPKKSHRETVWFPMSWFEYIDQVMNSGSRLVFCRSAWRTPAVQLFLVPGIWEARNCCLILYVTINMTVGWGGWVGGVG